MPRAGRGAVFPIMFLGVEGEALRSSECKILVCGGHMASYKVPTSGTEYL